MKPTNGVLYFAEFGLSDDSKSIQFKVGDQRMTIHGKAPIPRGEMIDIRKKFYIPAHKLDQEFGVRGEGLQTERVGPRKRTYTRSCTINSEARVCDKETYDGRWGRSTREVNCRDETLEISGSQKVVMIEDHTRQFLEMTIVARNGTTKLATYLSDAVTIRNNDKYLETGPCLP